MDTKQNTLPVVYTDKDGNIVFREGSSELNDDWIKVADEGNTDEAAYQESLEIHRRKLTNRQV